MRPYTLCCNNLAKLWVKASRHMLRYMLQVYIMEVKLTPNYDKPSTLLLRAANTVKECSIEFSKALKDDLQPPTMNELPLKRTSSI